MITKAFLIVFLNILQTQFIISSNLEFYVAVDGSDTLDGTSPDISESTTTGKVTHHTPGLLLPRTRVNNVPTPLKVALAL